VPLDEAGGHLVSGPPDGATARAVGVSFVYGSGMEPAGALRSGLAAPLRRDGETVGFVAVYGRDPHDAVDEAAVAALEGLAAAAATALENARRYGEALRRAESDALTGLGNRRAFLDLLAREVGRAHRQEQRLSLLVLDLDSFAAVNERVGQLAGDTVLRDVAERLRDCLRGSDLACRIGGDEFAVVLPASGRIDAEAMFARLQATLLRTPPALADGITVSGGIAELAATDDALALFERGVEALAQAKAAGRGTAA
jgi:diguanylate cyclase (GGDEF)-like protein